MIDTLHNFQLAIHKDTVFINPDGLTTHRSGRLATDPTVERIVKKKNGGKNKGNFNDGTSWEQIRKGMKGKHNAVGHNFADMNKKEIKEKEQKTRTSLGEAMEHSYKEDDEKVINSDLE